MKYPTNEQVLVHLVEVAQAARDTGDAELAGQLVVDAYMGWEMLERREAASGREWRMAAQAYVN